MRVVVDHLVVEFHDAHGFAVGKCKNDVFLLMALRVCDLHQNCGIGTHILRFVADWCTQQGLRQIELYDMSKRYNAAHNIYLRAGFTYLNLVDRHMYATPSCVREALASVPRTP